MHDKYHLKHFDDFIEYRGALEGSGRSRKLWLQNENSNTIGLFKYPKSATSFDYFSEILATDIAQKLDIAIARVDIGDYNGERGSMSYQINSQSQNLTEGIDYIVRSFPDFDRNTGYSEHAKEYYSLDMIQRSLLAFFEEIYITQQPYVINMLIFDFLIGNQDRHQHNWGFITPAIKNNFQVFFSPLFDNSSSLCGYVNEEDIPSFFKDTRRFESYVNNGSKSLIRVDGKIKKRPTHYQMMEHVSRVYQNCFIDMTNKIKMNIRACELDAILSKYSDIISEQRLNLIKKYLLRKVELLTQIELIACSNI